MTIAPVYIDCVQGSEEWHMARLGIPTASQFDRIVTKTGKLSAQRLDYMGELLAAYFVGEVDAESREYDWEARPMSDWVARGKMLEPKAIEAYAFYTDSTPHRPGLVYRDESKMVACSPDWLIGDDGLGEVKCPMAKTHLIYLARYLARGILPSDYFCQVQGQLWVTGRAWCDFMSFYPGLPPLIVRVTPDDEYFAALDEHIPSFVAALLESREELIAKGCPRPEPVASSETDAEWFARNFGEASNDNAA